MKYIEVIPVATHLITWQTQFCIFLINRHLSAKVKDFLIVRLQYEHTFVYQKNVFFRELIRISPKQICIKILNKYAFKEKDLLLVPH